MLMRHEELLFPYRIKPAFASRRKNEKDRTVRESRFQEEDRFANFAAFLCALCDKKLFTAKTAKISRKGREEHRLDTDSISISGMPSGESTRRVGLARALSKLGYCSRAQAAALIRAGRVCLNDSVRRDPEAPVRIEQDRITVDGSAIEAEREIYLMMNKPRGLVTTASDEKGRETVYSLLGQVSLPWVAPVGRLDKASEGLLLLTNDSEWGARVSAPETHLAKTYHVQIGTVADDNLFASLSRGIKAEDGDLLRVQRVSMLRSGKKNCWLEIVLDEGKNRQIRRMFGALGIETLRLMRVAIGPLRLGQLAKGAYRPLTREEKRQMDMAMSKGSG
jgi:23S rRNA pseudouridine2605 synthase